jgi:predicted TIM-barrel fold metal-dependent hydrolase
MTTHYSRRDSIKMFGAMAASSLGTMACTSISSNRSDSPVAVKWSVGTELPRTRVPDLATDCHHHIYDARYPWAPQVGLKPGDATVEDYRVLQRRLGTTRNVIVQPSSYGVDNRLLVESLGKFNGHARGVAVVNTSVTDRELMELHQAGVRGIRFNLAQAGATTLDMVKPLAARVAALGWHIQLNAPANYLLEHKATWSQLPCPVVFDHLAHVPQPESIHHGVFGMVRDLLQKERAYVKLSGFYLDTAVGEPTYADSVIVAQAFAKEAPDRMLWGSDWPHPTEQTSNKIPDDALLLDLFAKAVPNDAIRNQILVNNPAKLYQFV